MRYFVKNNLKAYSVYQVTVIYIFVHFPKELKKFNWAVLSFAEAMLVFPL